MRQRIVNLNTYLFANIVVLCLLLLGLWRGRPVFDQTISLSGLLVILVVINTVLLFREGLLQTPKTPPRAPWPERLETLRRVMSGRPNLDGNFLADGLTGIQAAGDTLAMVLLHQEEAGHFTLHSQVGQLPPQWSAARLQVYQSNLVLRHPGSLGEETLHAWDTLRRPQRFVSGVTHLVMYLIPLTLPNAKRDLWVVFPRPKRSIGKTFLTTGALFLENLLALDFVRKTVGDGRYLDAQTGLLRFETFQDSFETEVERSERYHQQMTLLQLAVKPFDALQAPQQDLVQQAVATALRDSLRRLDLMFCGRRSGTFAAILTETNQEVARLVSERVIAAFQKHIQGKAELNGIPVALRIGTGTYPIDATHGDGLQEKSEEALQKALEQGRTVIAYGTMHQAEAASTEETTTKE